MGNYGKSLYFLAFACLEEEEKEKDWDRRILGFKIWDAIPSTRIYHWFLTLYISVWYNILGSTYCSTYNYMRCVWESRWLNWGLNYRLILKRGWNWVAGKKSIVLSLCCYCAGATSDWIRPVPDQTSSQPQLFDLKIWNIPCLGG